MLLFICALKNVLTFSITFNHYCSYPSSQKNNQMEENYPWTEQEAVCYVELSEAAKELGVK